MAGSFASGNHLDSSAPFAASKNVAFGVWIKPTSWTNAFVISLHNSGSAATRDIFALNADTVGLGVQAFISGPSFGSSANSTAAVTTGAWQFAFVSFGSTTAAYEAGANKGTGSSQVPSGINTCVVGTRPGGAAPYVGLMAHAMGVTRIPNDLEVSFLGAGGHPRALQSLIYFCRMNQGNANADVGSMNLTATGTTFSNADMPVIATHYTGTAIADQVWTQNSAITPVASGFEDVSSAFTQALYKVGASGGTTTANGAGSVARVIIVNSATGIVANDYLTVGAGSLTRILSVSGTSVLVDKDQTWANTDTVTHFPVSSQSITGIVVTSGLSGTPTGTLAQTANYFTRGINNTTAALVADSNLFQITINAAAGGGTPAFSAGPTLNTRNTDGYTFGATPSQTATCHLGVYLCDSPAPTAAQVRTAAGTGFVSHFTAAGTAATPFTVSATALTNPIYDVYLTLNNVNGDSAVSGFPATVKAPATGRAYTTLGSLSASSPFQGIGLAVSDMGDYVATITLQGYAVSMSASGDVQVNSNGDQSRQLFLYNFYDRSAQAMIYSSDSTYAINDLPPQSTSDPNAAFTYTFGAGTTIASIDLTPLFTDPEGDGFTITQVGSALAAIGLTLSGNALSGTTFTPPAAVSTTVSFIATDTFGNASVTIKGLIVIGVATMVDLTGDTQVQADVALQGLFCIGAYTMTNDTITPPRALGLVISQDIVAGVLVQVGTTINIVLSTGLGPGGSPAPSGGTAMSSQLIMEEQLGRLNQFPTVEAYGTVVLGSADLAGRVYRACRVPSGARIVEVSLVNDENPTGSNYQCGFLISPSGGLVVAQSDSVLFANVSLDERRAQWVNLYQPAIANGTRTSANLGLRVWELLALPNDPSASTLVDVLYDVALTAVTPGTSGATVVIRVVYYPAPPRGLGAPVESPW